MMHLGKRRFNATNYQCMDQAYVNIEDTLRTATEICDHNKWDGSNINHLIEIAQMILRENSRLMELGDE
jgi:hypothetical protein